MKYPVTGEGEVAVKNAEKATANIQYLEILSFSAFLLSILKQ